MQPASVSRIHLAYSYDCGRCVEILLAGKLLDAILVPRVLGSIFL